jgi:hypothetical protein
MSKTWVLDTETKGTGAHVVPLETVLRKPEAGGEAAKVSPAPRRRSREPAPAPAPSPPRRFRVVDLMTRRVLVDDADARATVEALRDVRSIVDVDVYIADGDDGEWRPLSLAAQKKLWALGHTDAPEPAQPA